MGTWTTQQVEALAPDPSSAKAGKGLATTNKWRTLGASEAAVWGECQGSGKDPYQTQVDLSEPAFRCSCPSRKFPCKHGLGLMLIYAAQPAAFNCDTPPEWVTGWLETRAQKAVQKAEKQAQKLERAAEPVDLAAQAKRAALRESKVTAGLEYVETWLKDMVRSGIAGVPAQPYTYWQTPAARMVDAQAPGISRLIREMSTVSSREGWQERLLERAGSLQLLLEGFRRLDTLPAETQADIRSLIGWTLPQEEVLARTPDGEGVRDRWVVVGRRVEDEERLRVQRTWLWGQQSGGAALLLNFAAFGQPLDHSLAPGSCVDAELVFYPSAHSQRALVRTRYEPAAEAALPAGYSDVRSALNAYAAALSVQPWLEEFPLLLRQVVPAGHDGEWRVQDVEGYSLPISAAFTRSWHLLALSGGHPIDVFGEWNGDQLMPLSVWAEGAFHPLAVTHG